MTPRQLSKIGFFHYGQAHATPLPTLKDAIADVQRRCGKDVLNNALVVLPEAFNIQKPYFDESPPNTNQDILSSLAGVCSCLGCAFVAGLIIDDLPGVSPPHSSAYLIDGDDPPRLLSRKKKKDDTELTSVRDRGWRANYTAYNDFYTVPVHHRGLAIVALICLDAEPDHEDPDSYVRRFERVNKGLRGLGASHNVVCIPARMSNGLCGGQPGVPLRRGDAFQETIWVMANAHVGVNSFVTDTSGLILEPVGTRAECKIEVRTLESCQSTES